MSQCRHCGQTFHPGQRRPCRYCSHACHIWAKVEVRGEDECWPHRLASQKGYGRLPGTWGTLIHRAVYWLAHGCKPLEGVICHHCDNPSCCNPAHLYEGTMLDNMRDRDSRGRANSIQGERAGNATITNAQARLIKAVLDEARRGPSGRLRNGEADKIALAVGTTKQCVQRIKDGRHWQRVL